MLGFRLRPRSLAAVAASLAACYDGRDDGDDGVADDGPQAEVVELAGTLALTSTCVALEPGEHPAAISPAGDLWLATTAGPSADYRVFSIDGSVRYVQLEHATDRLQAWDASHVHYIAPGPDGDRLWLSEIDEELTEPLYWPADLDAPADFCGDPTIDGDGFVLAGDALLQRDAGLWWRWLAPGGGDFGPVASLGRSYGACVDRRGDLWLATEAGAVWRIGANEARNIDALAGAETLVFDEAFGAAGLIDGAVIHGAPEAGWTAPRFPAFTDEAPDQGTDQAVTVTALAASSGRLWVGGSFGLLAFDGQQWLAVQADGVPVSPASTAALWADGDAVWISQDSQLCRLSQGAPVQLAGLRPLQRVVEPWIDVVVAGPGAAALGAMELHLDGQSVASLDGGTLPWSVQGIALGEPGWHTLELVGTSGPARAIDLELRVPTVGTWLDDIQPLAELHCAGINGCHGSEVAGEGRPVLTEYEGWVLSADAIRARVGLTGDMPPPANRLESWDAEEVALILTWLEAGMPIGSE